MIDKAVVRRNFSKKASLYDKYASVQRQMAREVVSAVDFKGLGKSPRLLEIGSGTGYMTGLIERKADHACSIDAVDISEGMVDYAKDIFQNRINFICDDIESMELEASYDIVTSNATFQWLNDFDKTSYKLLRALKAGGHFVFSTFGDKTFQELHTSYDRAKSLLGLEDASRLGQSFYSISHIRDIISQNMIRLEVPVDIRIREDLIFKHFNSSREFLHSVKNIGAGSTEHMASVKTLKETMRIYDKYYRDEYGVRATYHCIYVEVRRG